MTSSLVIVAEGGDGSRWMAAAAMGTSLHRFLWGDGPEGPWCGVGAHEAQPALAATRTRSAWSADDAGALAGRGAARHEATVQPPSSLPAGALGHPHGPAAALLEALGERLAAPDDAVQSVLVTGFLPERPIEAWMALGPPLVAVLVRCWPGHPQTPDAAGEGAGAARLAIVARGVAGAVAGQSLTPRDVAAGLAAARRRAAVEGGEAERQAAIMDAAGDDRGGAVRRIVGQAFSVGEAVAALESLLAAAGAAAAPR